IKLHNITKLLTRPLKYHNIKAGPVVRRMSPRGATTDIHTGKHPGILVSGLMDDQRPAGEGMATVTWAGAASSDWTVSDN
ncbi:MAG: hypothetical protein ABF876_15080, partial [Acetobacter aceti]